MIQSATSTVEAPGQGGGLPAPGRGDASRLPAGIPGAGGAGRVSFPDAVVLARDVVFDLASAAHAVSFSLREMGFPAQVAMLDGIVEVLEERLAGGGRTG